MTRISTCLLAFFGVVGLTTAAASAQSWPPTKEDANKAIVEWLRANSKFGPDSDFVSDMANVAEEEIEKNMSINFFFGSDLMESGNFKSLSVLCNQVVTFDMTAEQAAAMDLESSSVSTTTSGSHGTPAEKQSFELSQLVVNNGDAIGAHGKISGEIHCSATGEAPAKEYALRISYRGSQGVSQFKYLDAAPDASGQTIAFEFDPVNDDDVESPFKGPVGLLFDIVTVEQSGGDVNVSVHSNLVGTLATISD